MTPAPAVKQIPIMSPVSTDDNDDGDDNDDDSVDFDENKNYDGMFK